MFLKKENKKKYLLYITYLFLEVDRKMCENEENLKFSFGKCGLYATYQK